MRVLMLSPLIFFTIILKPEFNQKNWIAYLRMYASELYLNEKIIQRLEDGTNWLFGTAILLSLFELIK
jgi:hypothetical protein